MANALIRVWLTVTLCTPSVMTPAGGKLISSEATGWEHTLIDPLINRATKYICSMPTLPEGTLDVNERDES